MEIIGWNNIITITQGTNFDLIEFCLLNSLMEFKEAMKRWLINWYNFDFNKYIFNTKLELMNIKEHKMKFR